MICQLITELETEHICPKYDHYNHSSELYIISGRSQFSTSHKILIMCLQIMIFLSTLIASKGHLDRGQPPPSSSSICLYKHLKFHQFYANYEEQLSLVNGYFLSTNSTSHLGLYTHAPISVVAYLRDPSFRRFRAWTTVAHPIMKTKLNCRAKVPDLNMKSHNKSFTLELITSTDDKMSAMVKILIQISAFGCKKHDN